MFATIEDIVLAHDMRGISALRPYLPADFVADAARFLLGCRGLALIATGFHVMQANAPETDGPPGAAALGQALSRLGCDVVYVTDRFSRQVVEALAGDREVVEFPVAGAEESAALAADLLNRFKPSLLIAVERAGLLADGTYRNWRGEDMSAFNARIDCLFDGHEATVGIGDGGNEVGMGNFRHVISVLQGLPDEPSVTRVSRLVIASCSNWGAYGVVAALDWLTGERLLPTVDEGFAWVVRAVAAGAVDGLTGEAKAWVDGRSPEEDAFCLRELARWLRRVPRPRT